jgi:hypothetical protein
LPLTKFEGKASDNLEFDVGCKVGVFFFTVEWMLEMMEETKTNILSK